MSKNTLRTLKVLVGYAESTPDGQQLVGEHIKEARRLIRDEQQLRALERWRNISLVIATSIIDRIDGYHEEDGTRYSDAELLIDWIRERLATSIPEREE